MIFELISRAEGLELGDNFIENIFADWFDRLLINNQAINQFVNDLFTLNLCD